MSMKRSEERRKVAKEVLDRLLSEDISRDEIQDLKTEIASKNSCKIPSNEEVLELAGPGQREEVEAKLRRRPSRTKSGVSVVAVMTSPEKCPHGSCLYCPRGVELPQSYVDDEPAVMRAEHNNFDPYKQTEKRLEQLELTGHPTSKIDLIVMGGTFTAREESYQREFVKGCLDALNGERSGDLDQAKQKNETADHRCVGLTVGTRPDYFLEDGINKALDLGTTRVELGVQIPKNEIYEKVNRKHEVSDVVESTRLAKDSGLKITYHYMPDLPGSDPEMDLRYFKKLFSDERFMPDSLKIYPTLVIQNSELVEWYREGRYEPCTDGKLKELLKKIKAEIPPWVRVMRLQRDVPAHKIVAGCEKSNLRQIVRREMEKNDEECRCIRCREVGRNDHRIENLNFELRKRNYEASEGKEFFLSFEDTEKDVIAALLRLRIPAAPFRDEIDKKTGIVRELHVYGSEVPVESEEERIQNRGFGRRLLQEAEKVAKSRGMERMAVISGVGAREYYRKFDYVLEGAYMCRCL